MLVSALLFTLSTSWVDQALAIAGQIAMNQLGPSYSEPLAAIFSAATDDFSRPAQAAAWTRYVERAPFHIASFNQWHFYPNPYSPDGTPTTSHIQDDNLRSVIYGRNCVLYDLRTETFDRPWTFAWAVKVVMGGIADSFSALHTTELFSSDFPDGDDSGRRFPVTLGGHATTLFAAWESGCGAFADNLSFSASDWSAIDSWAEALVAEFPHPANSYNAPDTLRASTVFDQLVVYAGAARGQALSAAYVANCSAETRKRVAHAGYGLADYFSLFTIPTFASAGRRVAAARAVRAESGGDGIRASEIASWVLMALLAPAAAFLIWKRHFGMK
jgi:hypothetical protein